MWGGCFFRSRYEWCCPPDRTVSGLFYPRSADKPRGAAASIEGHAIRARGAQRRGALLCSLDAELQEVTPTPIGPHGRAPPFRASYSCSYGLAAKAASACAPHFLRTFAAVR